MRGKDFPTGLRGVLFEARHYRRMGAALWLYGWLVLRQTHQHGDLGWVLGGAPISYREIEEETGFNRRTLERWMYTLRRQGYVETESAPSGVIVRITKAKKFPQVGRRSADGVRNSADGSTQICGANARQSVWNQSSAGGISSSSVARSKDRDAVAGSRTDLHHEAGHNAGRNQNPKSSGSVQTQDTNHSSAQDPVARPQAEAQRRFYLEARLRQQLLRAEREDAVRRELAVGSGPEVRRS